MNLSDVTPLVLTFNEAPNIHRVLERLQWAGSVLVLDSGSQDGTRAAVGTYPNAKLLHRDFDDHAAQWNFGLGQVRTPWVLTLDADYVLGEGFEEELRGLEAGAAGYEVRFRYCVDGRPLRRSLYPRRVVLFRTRDGRYINDGHTQQLVLNGSAGVLRTAILHDDRKPLARWLGNQRGYARLEAAKIASAPWMELSWADRSRRLRLAPFLMPLYCLLLKGLLLEGRAGLRYTLERTYAESLLALEIAERLPSDRRITPDLSTETE